MDNLAVILSNKGRWDEAEKLQMQVMESFKRILGAEHSKTLVCMNKSGLHMEKSWQRHRSFRAYE